jgi:group I intron endonuclease
MKKTLPGVYMILNTVTNGRYVGSAARSMSSRWAEHRYALKKNIHRNPYLQNAWNKYGGELFSFIVLENTTPETALDAEQRWYDLFKSKKLPLYNLRENVKSQLGLKHSDSTKRKLSLINTGKKRTAETKKRIRKVKLGKKNPGTAKALARPFSFVDPSGNDVSGKNIKDFCRKNNLNNSAMGSVLKGIRASHKGWKNPKARAEYLEKNPPNVYGKAHFICPECGQEFASNKAAIRKFCSMKCRNTSDSRAYSGSGNPNYRHGKRVVEK